MIVIFVVQILQSKFVTQSARQWRRTAFTLELHSAPTTLVSLSCASKWEMCSVHVASMTLPSHVHAANCAQLNWMEMLWAHTKFTWMGTLRASAISKPWPWISNWQRVPEHVSNKHMIGIGQLDCLYLWVCWRFYIVYTLQKKRIKRNIENM